MLDPAECRRRTQACRETAAKGGVAAGEFLRAAATWETIAMQAEQQAAERLAKKPG